MPKGKVRSEAADREPHAKPNHSFEFEGVRISHLRRRMVHRLITAGILMTVRLLMIGKHSKRLFDYENGLDENDCRFPIAALFLGRNIVPADNPETSFLGRKDHHLPLR